MGLIHNCLRALSRLFDPGSAKHERPATALIVVNRAGPLMDGRVECFEETLVGAARDRREKLVRASDRCAGVPAPGEAAWFSEIRRLRQGRLLIVTIFELSTELVVGSLQDPEYLRVDATLCVSSMRVNGLTGSIVETRTHAICRRTPPIVPGTGVGGDVVDGLLAQMAESIVGQGETARLAA